MLSFTTPKDLHRNMSQHFILIILTKDKFSLSCHPAKVHKGEKGVIAALKPRWMMKRHGLFGRRPSSQRQTLGNNGAGDGWRSRPRPLDRPINLDEALAAPSQIFPSAYFVKRLPPLLSLPWKPSRRISCGGFFRSASCRRERREVFVYFCRTRSWRVPRQQI